MITTRDEITSLFNGRFLDMDRKFKEYAEKIGLPLYKIPSVPIADDVKWLIASGTSGGSGQTLTITPVLGSSRMQSFSITAGYVPPYVCVIEVPNTSGYSTGMFVYDQTTSIVSNTGGNPVVPTFVGAFNTIGYYRDGIWTNTSGNSFTKINNPVITSDYDYLTPKTNRYGIRERAWGDLEFLNPRDNRWYSVRGDHLGKTVRRLGVFTQYVASLTITVINNYKE